MFIFFQQSLNGRNRWLGYYRPACVWAAALKSK